MHKKRILSLLAVAGILISAAACSPNGTGSTQSNDLKSEETSVKTNDINNKISKEPRAYLTSENSVRFQRAGSDETKVYDLSELDKSSGIVIELDPTVTYQTIDGFGASFTDSAAQMISRLSKEDQTEVMNRLFDKDKGIGLSYIRNPIGSTDFSTSWYTYDDMPEGEEDWELEHFSMAYDEKQVIPLTKWAKEINPDIKIMLSSWTAPAWMKTVPQLAGSAKGHLRRECYDVYSQYLLKVIEGYEAHGLDVYSMTIQNEPFLEPSWPGMYMTVSDQLRMLQDFLKPSMIEKKINTKVYALDYNWVFENEAMELMVAGGDSFSGIAYHHYGGNATMQKAIYDAFEDKDIVVSEASGAMGGFMGNVKRNSKNIIQSLRNGGKAYLLWNMALNTTGGPLNYTETSAQIGLINVDESDNSYYYTQDYYSLAHFSKFIHTGAKRIESTDTGALTEDKFLNVACLNPGGTITVVLYNTTEAEQVVKVVLGGKVLEYTLKVDAVATLTWDANEQ